MQISTRNPGYVSRRGDDRRIAQVIAIEPGRWDVFWADGASVSLLAPDEGVARLRAQLRRDEHERALSTDPTTLLLDGPFPTAAPTQTPAAASAVPPARRRSAPRGTVVAVAAVACALTGLGISVVFALLLAWATGAI